MTKMTRCRWCGAGPEDDCTDECTSRLAVPASRLHVGERSAQGWIAIDRREIRPWWRKLWDRLNVFSAPDPLILDLAVCPHSPQCPLECWQHGWADPPLPPGHLRPQGQALSRDDYPGLYDAIRARWTVD